MRSELSENKTLGHILKVVGRADLNGISNQVLLDFFHRHRLFAMTDDVFLGQFETKEHALWLDTKRKYVLRSIQLTQELVKIIKHLNTAEIEFVALKGPVLAHRLYGDIGERHFGDLDIVIKLDSINHVIHILGEIGYRMVYPKSGFSQNRWDYYFKYKRDVGLVHEDSGVVVELHVGVYRHELLRSVDEKLLWEGLDSKNIGGIDVPCMSLNNSFLYLLFHGGYHQYFRLFWLRDIAEALIKWNLDHKLILKNSLEMGIDRFVGVGLLLAEEFFMIPPPEEYDSYLSQYKSELKKLKLSCIDRINDPVEESYSMKLKRLKYQLGLKPGLNYKWSVFTSTVHRWYIRKFLGGQ